MSVPPNAHHPTLAITGPTLALVGLTAIAVVLAALLPKYPRPWVPRTPAPQA